MEEVSEKRDITGTIVFASVGRPRYAFDMFATSASVDRLDGWHGLVVSGALKEQRLTDGVSVNFNGHLVHSNAKVAVLDWIKRGGSGAAVDAEDLETASRSDTELLVYVSERDGSLRLYFSFVLDQLKQHEYSPEAQFARWEGISGGAKRGENFSLGRRMLGDLEGLHLQDRPQIGEDKIVFLATEQGVFGSSARQSWTAIYTVSFKDPGVVRLTPVGVSDFSPAISPSGNWIAVASLQGKGWQGEVRELDTGIFVFAAADGTDRRQVVEKGGWPSWSDESTVFFHRQAEDGWWSVFRASLPEGFLSTGQGEITVCRVTPPGVHAFTPSASRKGEWVAVATRRSTFRHVEIFDLRTRTFAKLTEYINPNSHHYNPFVSPNSEKIIYHRCRGNSASSGGKGSITPRLEPIECDIPGLALLRIEGNFPAFSHDGSTILYCNDFSNLVLTNYNGEGKRSIFNKGSFSTAWDWKRKGVIYTSAGGVFQSEATTVHVVAVFDVLSSETDKDCEYKVLTKEGTGNNAFPSPSPDGKYVVFRSGRSGYKNLYIMDAIDGEEGSIRQLTHGEWTDTMPNWSPTGEWIAFSSNRGTVEEGHFAGYIIRPDGTGLRKILSDGGRTNHVFFSPDGKSLVFTSDFAAVSAEPISTPNQFQPYGEIHICAIDGTQIHRLTHNAYEDGTPCWGPRFVAKSDLSTERGEPVSCGFDDTRWLGIPGATDVSAEPLPTWCPHMRRTT